MAAKKGDPLEENLFKYFGQISSEFSSLFLPETANLSNIDPSKGLINFIPSKFEKFTQLTFLNQYTTNPQQWVSLETVRRMTEMLKAPSLKKYLLTKQAEAKGGQLNHPFVQLIEKAMRDSNSPDVSAYLRATFSHNPYKKIDQANPLLANTHLQSDDIFPSIPVYLKRISNLNRLIELRSFIGLLDLTILFSRELVEKKKMRFTGGETNFLTTDGDPLNEMAAFLSDFFKSTGIGKDKLEAQEQAKKSWLNFVGASESNTLLKGQFPRAQNLFEDNSILKAFLVKNFEKAIKQEPLLIHVFPKFTHIYPVVSKNRETSLAKLLNSKKYFKPRTDIRIRRATLLFRSLCSTKILHNKHHRAPLEEFLTKNKFHDSRGFPSSNLERYYHELFPEE